MCVCVGRETGRGKATVHVIVMPAIRAQSARNARTASTRRTRTTLTLHVKVKRHFETDFLFTDRLKVAARSILSQVLVVCG